MRHKKIYFTILPSDHGFTYQLFQWGLLYNIGTILGYTYFHTAFACHRSQPADTKVDIYRFLGVTQHFLKQNTGISDSFEHRIQVHVPEGMLWCRRIFNMGQLAFHLKNAVAQQAPPNKKTLVTLIVADPDTIIKRHRNWGFNYLRALLMTIKLGARRCLRPSNPPWCYGPNLYSIYQEQRKAQPRPSRFPDGKTKIIVHIRRGDFAVIKPPWGGKKIECLTSGLRNRHIAVSDFAQFIQQLIADLKEYQFSSLFFSDGYTRTPQYLRENKQQHGLNDEQVAILSRQVTTEEEREFGVLRQIKNSQVIIGETADNLLDFIHSCLTADVIVTAMYYKFVRKLGSLYFNHQRAPVMIFLHQGDPDIATYPPLPAPSDKVIFFNVRDPDYAAFVNRLRQVLPAPDMRGE